MKKIILSLYFIFICSTANAAIWYIRTDGSNGTNCTGLADAAYDGSGTGEACALNSLHWVFPGPSNNTSRKASTSDTVIVKSGSYRIGCQNAANCDDSNLNVVRNCSPSFPYDCILGDIPDNVTLIGCSTTGCLTSSDRPELWGAGRVKQVLSAKNSTGVTIKDFEVTDHASCGFGHSTLSCGGADSSELSAAVGIRINNATDLTITNVNMHGFRSAGLKGGGVNGMTVTGSNINYNSFVGYDGDSCSGSGTCGNTGTISFIDTTIDFNGCVEDNPGNGTIKDKGCYSQDQTGYGDGVGMGNTAGQWVFTDSSVSHNVSDGLDLLYANRGTYSGATVTILRSKFEGNAGNQVKIPNATTIEDSFIIGNCGYFDTQTFTCDNATCGSGFNNCRAFGTPLILSFKDDTVPKFYSNTLTSNGDLGISAGGNCTSGTNILVKNNIFFGGFERNQPGFPDLFFVKDTSACNATFVEDYNVCDQNWKQQECNGANDVTTSDIQFTGTILIGDGQNSTTGFYTDDDFIDQLTLASGSPARGVSDESLSGDDSLDFNKFDRGAQWDAGGFEFGTVSGTGSSCGDNVKDNDEVCDGTDLDNQTCVTRGFTSGTLACNGDCLSFNESSCVTDLCGNGNINPGEECDGSNLDGGTCISEGFASGTLACAGTCLFDTSGCVAITCQDGIVQVPEECDDGNSTEGDGCSSLCENETPGLELFLNYTETDTADFFDVKTHDIVISGATHATDANVKKDFGAGNFGDFVHRIQVTVDSCSDNGSGEDGGMGVWAMSSSSYDDLKELQTANDGISLSLNCFSSQQRHTWVLTTAE